MPEQGDSQRAGCAPRRTPPLPARRWVPWQERRANRTGAAVHLARFFGTVTPVVADDARVLVQWILGGAK